ncbi:MAG: exo-beta-N-acetylmuramidase NamZ domain-containing protein [Fidelibacterota bacterium]
MKKIIFVLITISISLAFAEIETRVKPGIDVLLAEQLDWVKGKNVGLITNATGVNSQLQSTIDLLHDHRDVNLVAVFGPEHGARGNVHAGDKIDDILDEKTGIRIFSLYGINRKPSQEMLKNVDVLLYDIQDIGCRSYTYIYTMSYSMEAARESNIPFIVLDRPNPLGGELVDGPILEKQYKSFVGMYPIPYVYGLTCGEIAKFFNKEYDINCDLKIVKMKGWKREMTFEDTGLQWIPTSPHIPHAISALYYPTTGIIGELHTLDIGIGYTNPFEFLGQTWIDGSELAEELNSRKIDGIYFRPIYYTPYYFKNEKKHLQGVHLHIYDDQNFKPVEAQIHMLTAVKKLYPDQDIFNPTRNAMFDKVVGLSDLREDINKGVTAEEIINAWRKDLKNFKEKSKKYYLYD